MMTRPLLFSLNLSYYTIVVKRLSRVTKNNTFVPISWKFL